ncbi:MAG: hypothetical protein FD139_3752 [Methylocystaceae bacterium]|nr:MAG: hypothetical protein FD172_3965 [Methylocystaceae bacterium]TXT42275.1 MAG: hypothetical protein FD139_3752 [Methylocystaceae bacterium]
MTTLAALDLSVLTEGLRRRLAARNRAALDDLAAAVQSAERYRAQTADRSRAPAPPRRGERPGTGPRAPAPGEKSRADDELRVKRAVAAKGSVSQTDVSARAPATVAETARPSSPALGGRAPATGAAIASVRSALIAKANLAAGSQAAVVKIASFGSGAARAQALLSYQSDKGELTLERHDGLMITGQRSVADFAATWRAKMAARRPTTCCSSQWRSTPRWGQRRHKTRWRRPFTATTMPGAFRSMARIAASTSS